MNYYRPLEIRGPDGEPTGRYHYTVTNDGRARPVGACADGCPGHDTPEEARAHFRQYLLSRATYDHRMSGQQLKCEVCGEFTQGFAQAGPYEIHVLCDAHRNIPGLEQVLKVGDMASSA